MKVKNKAVIEDIAKEWDKAAHIRFNQIKTGRDISFRHVLLPTILELSKGIESKNVLDVGCGLGFITAELSLMYDHVTGIDPSSESISLAQSQFINIPNIKFENLSAEDFSKSNELPSYSLIVANMTLMTAPSLDSIIDSISNLLVSSGSFIFTITHPCFWPFYWNYVDASWFDYKNEIVIESPFKISLDQNEDLVTTHVHRPLEQYMNTLISYGLKVDLVLEPYPSASVMRQYPEPWKYPRFLAVRCQKN